MTPSHELDVNQTARRALEAARAVWGVDWSPSRIAIAPGRIEILGNHVDYNGGPVLAAAVDRATVILSDDAGEVTFLFADFRGEPVISIDPAALDALRSKPGSPRPHDFALGVMHRVAEKGSGLRPGRSVVATSIPIGSGMSSSAALSVALSLVLNWEPPTSSELVYDAQAAENWTGVPCGTMDQSASVFGQVIRYEGPDGTRSISPELDGYCFVVVDSRVERTLGTSSYPVRVRECAEAVLMLENAWGRPLGNLAHVDPASLEIIEESDPALLPSHLRARTRHIVTEIGRVGEGEAAMAAQDWEKFGAIMNASGASSAGDYDISHPRVEALVRVMRDVPGVAGARMMGGGEGGSALALLRISALDELRAVLVDFFGDDGLRSTVVPLAFAPGARLLTGDEMDRIIQ